MSPAAKGPVSRSFGASIRRACSLWWPAVTEAAWDVRGLLKIKKDNKNWEGVIKTKGDEKKSILALNPLPPYPPNVFSSLMLDAKLAKN